MSSLTTERTALDRTSKLPRYVVISAWAVPVLIVGQFALVGVVPVFLVTFGVWRNATSRALRWSATALAAAYATPLVIWALRTDPAQSLSKDLNPILAGVVVAASAAVLALVHLRRR